MNIHEKVTVSAWTQPNRARWCADPLTIDRVSFAGLAANYRAARRHGLGPADARMVIVHTYGSGRRSGLREATQAVEGL